jgi:steroid 5-alpha-reductase
MLYQYDFFRKNFYDVNENNSYSHEYNQLSLFFLMFFAMFYSFFFMASYYGRHSGQRKFFTVTGKTSWILQECPTVFVTIYFLITSEYEILSINFLGVVLFLMHYLHRTFIYPFIAFAGPKDNEKLYPAELTLMAFMFCFSNAYIQNNSLLLYSTYSKNYLISVYFISGVTVFLLGMFINVWHDYRMINLRRKAQGEYVVPSGGLYELISCPNYLGEILEWTGFYIAFGTLSAFIFAFSTFANLFPRALANHQWNITKFRGAYPNTRKAMIPFII